MLLPIRSLTLARNHGRARELLVGFHKRDSGRPSITWQQSVDEALCFGWIDGIRRRIDNGRYTIRFTPRRRGSIWSAVNIRRAQELQKLGRMEPAGLAAFEARRDDRSAIYSYEQPQREERRDEAEATRDADRLQRPGDAGAATDPAEGEVGAVGATCWAGLAPHRATAQQERS